LTTTRHPLTRGLDTGRLRRHSRRQSGLRRLVLCYVPAPEWCSGATGPSPCLGR
jgi:hypothetical protein